MRKTAKFLICLFATFALCQLAGATCNAAESLVEFSSTGAAVESVKALAGCTIYLDGVSASIYNGSTSTAHVVYVVGASTSSCTTTVTNYFAEFPLAADANKQDTTTISFGTNGLAMPSGNGPYLCVYFSGWNSGDNEYSTLLWHSQ